jgi:integrase
MRVRLKGIHTVRRRLADGSVRVHRYAWRGGPGLSGEPGTEEFVASYVSATTARREAKQEFASLLDLFERSVEFSKLAKRTQSDYLKHLGPIRAKFGSMPLAAFMPKNTAKTRGLFKSWRDELFKRSPRQSDYAWSVLARVCSVAKDRGLIDTNPCERGGRNYKADRSDALWTDELEGLFLAKAPQHLHLALMLALWTGQRQGDLLRMTWGQYDGTYIRLRQGKTGRRLQIRVGKPLKEMLDSTKRRGALILLNLEGLPWTEGGFRASWGKACEKAGIDGVTFHDMRGSAVTRLAHAGCEVPEIATFTGHSLRDVTDILDAHYLSRDQRLSDSAVAKLEASQTARGTNL